MELFDSTKPYPNERLLEAAELVRDMLQCGITESIQTRAERFLRYMRALGVDPDFYTSKQNLNRDYLGSLTAGNVSSEPFS